jgi:hypothetical protein
MYSKIPSGILSDILFHICADISDILSAMPKGKQAGDDM